MAGVLHGDSRTLKYLLLIEKPLPNETKPWSTAYMIRYLRTVFGVKQDNSDHPKLPPEIGIVSLLSDAFTDFTLRNVELHVPKLKKVLQELPHLELIYGTTPRLTTLIRCAFNARQAYGYSNDARVSEKTMSVDGAEFGNGGLTPEYRISKDWVLPKNKDLPISYIPGIRAFHYAPLLCPSHVYQHSRVLAETTLGKKLPYRLDKLFSETICNDSYAVSFVLALIARSEAVSLIRSQLSLTYRYCSKYSKAVHEGMVRPLAEFSRQPIRSGDFKCHFDLEGKTPTTLNNFGERVRECNVSRRFMHVVPNNAASEAEDTDLCLTNWEYDQTENRFFLYGVTPNHYTTTIALTGVFHRFYIEPTVQLDEILGLSSEGECVFYENPGRYCDELSSFLWDGLCSMYSTRRRTPDHALAEFEHHSSSDAFRVSVAKDKRWTHLGFQPNGKTVLQVDVWHYNAVEDAYNVLKAAHLSWDRANSTRGHRQCPLNVGERTLSAREQLSIFYGLRASHWLRFPGGTVAFNPLGNHTGDGSTYGLQVFGKCQFPDRIQTLETKERIPLNPLKFTRNYMLGSFEACWGDETYATTSADQPGMVNLGFDIECCAIPFGPDGRKRRTFFPDPRFDGVITIGTALEFQHRKSEYRKDHAYISKEYPSRVVFQIGTVDESALEHVPENCPEDLAAQIKKYPTRCFQFESEYDLLACFFVFYKSVLPSVDITHNGNIFDWKYLIERARVLGVLEEADSLGFNPHRCMRHLERSFVSRAYGEKIINTYAGREGVIGVDTYDTYTRERKERSYKLDALAIKYLKVGKDDMPYSAIYGYQASGPTGRALIAKYCVRDSQLPVQLCNHSRWITSMVAFARVCGTVECARMYTAGAQEKVLGVMNRVNQTHERGILFYDPCSFIKERNMAIFRRQTRAELASRGYILIETKEGKEAMLVKQGHLDKYARENEVRSGFAAMEEDGDAEESDEEMEDDPEPAEDDVPAASSVGPVQTTLEEHTDEYKHRIDFILERMEKMNIGANRKQIRPGMKIVLESGNVHTLTEKEATALRYTDKEFRAIEKKAREAKEARLARGVFGQEGGNSNDDAEQENRILDEIYAHVEAICGAASKDAAAVLSRTAAAYKGAVVLKPRAGLQTLFPILCLDFNSLYPSLAMEYNISFDTILYESDFLARDYVLADGRLLDKEVDCWLSPDQGINPFTERVENVYFVKEHVWRGLVPLMEIVLKETRTATKREMAGFAAKVKVDGQWIDNPIADPVMEAVLNGKQDAEKLIMNSTYGSLGAEGKASNKNCAAAITGFGRVEILKVKNFCKAQFGAVRDAGDTDSVMMHFPGLPEGHPNKGTKYDIRIETVEQAEFYAKFLESEINAISGPYIRIEYEKCFDPAVFTKKKRYISLKFIVACKPVIDAKGNEGKRRDALPLTATIINKVCEHIFVKHNPGEETRAEFSARVWKRVDESMDIVRQAARDLLAGKVPTRFLILCRQVSRLAYKKNAVLPHLETIKRLRKRGEPLPPVGNRVPFVQIREPHDPRTGKPRKNSEMVDDPVYVMQNNIPINYTHIFDTKFRKPMINFYKYVLSERCKDAIMERHAFSDLETGERRYSISRSQITNKMLEEETESILFDRRMVRDTFLDKNEQTRYMGSTTIQQLSITEENSPLMAAINRQRKRKRNEVQGRGRLEASFADFTRALDISRVIKAEENETGMIDDKPSTILFEPETSGQTVEKVKTEIGEALEILVKKMSTMQLEHKQVMKTCRDCVGAHEIYCENYTCPNFEDRVGIPGKMSRTNENITFLNEIREASNIEDLIVAKSTNKSDQEIVTQTKMTGYFERQKQRKREAQSRQRKRQKKKLEEMKERGEELVENKTDGLVSHFHQLAKKRAARAAEIRKLQDNTPTGKLSNYFRKFTKQVEAPLVDQSKVIIEAASSQ